jgi:hypothetical protein
MWRRGSRSSRRPSRKPQPDPHYQPVDFGRLSAADARWIGAAQEAETQLKQIASWTARLANQLGGGTNSTGVPQLDAAGRELMQASARAARSLQSVQQFLRTRGH